MLASLSGSGLWEVWKVTGPDPVRGSEGPPAPPHLRTIPDAAVDSHTEGWDQSSVARKWLRSQTPSALAAMTVKQQTYHPTVGSGNGCPTDELMSLSDILNSYVCSIFESYDATSQTKVEAEERKWILAAGGWGGAEAGSFCRGRFQ